MQRKIYLAFAHGSWYAREHVPDFDDTGIPKIRERWHSLGIKGKHKRAAAVKALEAFKQRRAQGFPSAGSVILFGQFASLYLNSVKLSVRPKTLESYEMWVRMFETQFGTIPLTHITPSLIDRWKVQLATHYSPTSVNIALRTIRAAFSYARKHGMIDSSPMDPIAAVDVPKHDFPPFWRREQFDRFIDTVDIQRQRTAFSLAFFAGLRLGEVVALRWEDVREDHIVIESRTERRTKSDRSRKVPLFSTLRGELENTARRSEYVIAPHKRTRLAADPIAINQRFREILRGFNAGADEPLPIITFHGLRHSFATNLAPHVSVAVLRQLLGHSDIKTTMVYLHVQDDIALSSISHIDM